MCTHVDVENIPTQKITTHGHDHGARSLDQLAP